MLCTIKIPIENLFQKYTNPLKMMLSRERGIQSAIVVKDLKQKKNNSNKGKTVKKKINST